MILMYLYIDQYNNVQDICKVIPAMSSGHKQQTYTIFMTACIRM